MPGSKWQNCKARSYTWYNAIKKVNNAAQGNNTPCRTFLLKNTDEMKRFSYLIILLLTTFMVACEYDSPYSNYPVRFVFDSTIHPYNQARSFGEFICIKKGNPGQYKLTDALGNTQTEHTTDNLKKLCVEIAEFCRAVYASTINEQERRIYFDMLEKLNKK